MKKKADVNKSAEVLALEQEVMRRIVIEYVHQVRSLSPRTGCQKLYIMCRTFFCELFRMGRDSFYPSCSRSA